MSWAHLQQNQSCQCRHSRHRSPFGFLQDQAMGRCSRPKLCRWCQSVDIKEWEINLSESCETCTCLWYCCYYNMWIYIQILSNEIKNRKCHTITATGTAKPTATITTTTMIVIMIMMIKIIMTTTTTTTTRKANAQTINIYHGNKFSSHFFAHPLHN